MPLDSVTLAVTVALISEKSSRRSFIQQHMCTNGVYYLILVSNFIKCHVDTENVEVFVVQNWACWHGHWRATGRDGAQLRLFCLCETCSEAKQKITISGWYRECVYQLILGTYLLIGGKGLNSAAIFQISQCSKSNWDVLNCTISCDKSCACRIYPK